MITIQYEGAHYTMETCYYSGMLYYRNSQVLSYYDTILLYWHELSLEEMIHVKRTMTNVTCYMKHDT